MTHRTPLGRSALAAAFSAAAALASGSAAGETGKEGKLEVGVLTCDLTQSTNRVVLSETEYLCTLDARNEAQDGTYVAEIDKVGVDLSATDQETVKWAVLATSEKFSPGMMDGTFVGASADVAAGKGAGVRALVGGEADSISLQPVSVSAQEGIGVAAGLETMELRRVETR